MYSIIPYLYKTPLKIPLIIDIDAEEIHLSSLHCSVMKELPG
jgi:hypothetical protein